MTTALASDFDGTLYFMRQTPHLRDGDLAGIQAFQEAGGLFGICTGRSLTGIRQVVEDRIRFDYYILASGALVLDRECQTIHKACLPRKLVGEIHDRYFGQVDMVIQANDRVYTFGKPLPMQVPISHMDDIEGDDIYGLSFGAKQPDKAKRIRDEIMADYSDVVNAFVNVNNVDMAAQGCSKGQAIAVVRKALGIDTIGGIGDSYNDIPMLEVVDHAYTFHTAPQVVQDTAEAVVDSVAEAIALMQKKLIGER